MVWTVTEPAGSTTIPNGAMYIRGNNTAIQAVLTAARLNAGTVIPDIFVGGGLVKTWFYLNVAPTHWTEVAALGDTLLAVKGGTTYTTGGATAGTWTQPSHALVTAELPAHTHATGSYTDIGAAGGRICLSLVGTGTARVTGSTGSGTAHNHGTTYRPAARVGIICSLN